MPARFGLGLWGFRTHPLAKHIWQRRSPCLAPDRHCLDKEIIGLLRCRIVESLASHTQTRAENREHDQPIDKQGLKFERVLRLLTHYDVKRWKSLSIDASGSRLQGARVQACIAGSRGLRVSRAFRTQLATTRRRSCFQAQGFRHSEVEVCGSLLTCSAWGLATA